MKKSVFCHCKEWHKYLSIIDDSIKFCWNQAAAPKEKIKMFKYCPYCGRQLFIYSPFKIERDKDNLPKRLVWTGENWE